MSWPPALAIAGEDWEGLYLGVLLNDPYPAVRHIASRSLRRLPGFEDFEYDAMAPQTALQDKGNEALQQWAARHAQLRTSFKAELLIDYDGPRMQALLQLLKGRDDRPVMFAE